jgi:hypothetical protein
MCSGRYGDLHDAYERLAAEHHNLGETVRRERIERDDHDRALHDLLTAHGVSAGTLYARINVALGQRDRFDRQATDLAAALESIAVEIHEAGISRNLDPDPAKNVLLMVKRLIADANRREDAADREDRAVPEPRRLVILQALDEWHGSPDAASIVEMIPATTLAHLKVSAATMERHVASLFAEGYLTRTFVNRRAHYALSLMGRDWLVSVTDARRSA